MRLIVYWLQSTFFVMGYPVIKNYLLAKTYQYLFPWMDLTLASIMSVVIFPLIIGVINILSTGYRLTNIINDELMSLLAFANSVHSAWAFLMCHMLLNSSAVVDECLFLEMKYLKDHSCGSFNGPLVFNSLDFIYILQSTASDWMNYFIAVKHALLSFSDLKLESLALFITHVLKSPGLNITVVGSLFATLFCVWCYPSK